MSCTADTTTTSTLPIREKSTTTETAGTPSLAARPDETNTAGLAGTANLADTLAKTHISDSKTDTTIGKNEPPLAGFAENRTINPEDKSQRPAEVSNATTGDTLTSTKTADDTSAGITGTQNLSDTLAKTNPSTVSPVTSPKGTPAIGNEGPDILGTTKGTGEHTVSTGIPPAGVKESDRTSAPTSRSRGDSLRAVLERADMVTGILETKNEKNEEKDKKEVSPSGDKEKVSKMEKLKEKLHIGHKH